MAADYPGRMLHQRAVALHRVGRAAEALAVYDQALALSPSVAALHYDKALSLWALGRGAETLAAYDAALRLQPGMVEALFNRAMILHAMQRLPEALVALNAVLALRRDLAPAWNNRAGLLLQLGNFNEALNSMDEVLKLQPGDASVHYNRGTLLLSLKRFEEAQASFEAALRLDAGHREALGLLVSSAMRVCDWRKVTALAPGLLAQVAAGQALVPPLTLIGLSDDPVLQRRCAQANLAKMLAGTAVAANVSPKWRGERYRHEKIRLAYISSDLCDHPVGNEIVDLLERHDRKRFEVLGIGLRGDDGSQTHKRIVKACDQFHHVWDKGDEQAAALLRRLEVDILVDLNGQTFGWRPGVLKYRPAPVQAVYLGYAGTTGADFLDYIIADRQVAPMESQPFFSEKIVQLPDCFWPAAPLQPLLPPPGRAAMRLPAEGFVFCCFNVHWKIGPDLFAAWMRLLAAVPGSVLWLRAADESITRNLRHAAQQRGVDPDRLIWAQRLENFEQHLARHAHADLFLDTFPYNAHVTGSDALRAGLPLLTLRGRSFVSRVGASFLAALGLPELVADSLADYEALALALARDPARLHGLRARLQESRFAKPLFDAPRFARAIEAAYTQMHARVQRGEAPSAFALPAGD